MGRTCAQNRPQLALKIVPAVLAFPDRACYYVFCGSWLRAMNPSITRQEVNPMKKDIHPKYGPATVRCVCGETFETGSIRKDMRVDICSKCHPFYTGKQKLVDTGGRVDRFMRRYGKQTEEA